MDDPAIIVKNVSKAFKLPHEKQSSLKGLFVNVFRRQHFEQQRVLKDVSFEIEKGEFFGIVGRNGSGKSTLLKLLAGIYSQDKGDIRVNGKLTPFIELGVGFNPELTGRENVFLNGALLGFNRKEMYGMYDEIVEFAELEKFMDQKLKNYSSGMQVRLAFSIAIRAKSDILLLDEVLAVGDENFQQKCYDYFSQLKKEGRTVILVSHDMAAVKNYCTNALLIHDGEIKMGGSVKKVVDEYTDLNITKLQKDKDSSTQRVDSKRWGNGDAEIKRVWTTCNSKRKSIFKPDEQIEVNIEIVARKELKAPVVGMVIHDFQDRLLFASNTNELEIKNDNIAAGERKVARFTIQNIYTNGAFSISCGLANSDRSTVFSRVEEACTFRVMHREMPQSLAHPDHSFNLVADSET